VRSIAGVTIAASLVASLARSQPPPRGAVESCTTSECHVEVTDHRHRHGPVEAGLCEVCHVATDVDTHRFELTKDALCTSCHDLVDAGGAHVHAPLAGGDCISCHDPHGSDHPMMLADDPATLCISCHQDATPGAHAHAGTGDCLSCHYAHASDHDALLQAPGRELCVGCHADDIALGAGARVHGPVMVDCLPCHAPHGTPEPALLRAPAIDLCTSCHGDTGTSDEAHSHALVDDQGCLNCHGAHAGHGPELLAAEPVELCLTCHAKDIPRADGSVVAGLADLARPEAHRHAPLDDRGCGGCHELHGGSHDFLLTRPFEGRFYQAFDEAAYALCLECHDLAAFTEARTTTGTAFRNGDLNLHYVHVALPGAKGRSCRVCHTAHASTSPKLMRKRTPFGEWSIPIELEVTDTGGSCAAGCHRARSYDREAAYDPPSPAGSPGGSPAPTSEGD
jgi:predicted CXXCH cytochrome family protein